jgi:glycosyltransferase involved in cell wall biosynthesis
MGPGAIFHLESNPAWPVSTLLTIHGALEAPNCNISPNALGRHLLSAADWIFCCSRAVHDQLQAVQGPEVSSRSSVRYCGVREPSAAPADRPLDAPRLLCVGRLIHRKGYDVALRAFASVSTRWPAARLTIGGRGPECERLRELAATLGIAESVDFIGFVPPDEVPVLMNKATMVIVPSRHEGFGLVAVEAAMMERPVVASAAGGLLEAVEHEKTGLLVAPEDSDGLMRAIAKLLEDPELADRMGRAGRKRAQELFSWEGCLDEHQARYRQLIEEEEDVRRGRTRSAQ